MSISIEGMNETSDFETSLERLKDVEPQDNWTEEDWKHFKTIKLALKKQIPQKPLNKTAEYNGEYGECPCCKHSVSDYDNFRVCSQCGQALDWKD